MISNTNQTISQAINDIKNSTEIVDRIRNQNCIFETMVLWMDLLGFRKHLDDDNLDINNENVLLGMKYYHLFYLCQA